MVFLRRHLPALLLGAAILAVSGGPGSADSTGSWTEPLLLRLGLSTEVAAVVHRGLRKIGHVVAYAVFAWLALRSIRGERDTTRRHSLLAFGVAVGVAIADEAIQAFTPARGGSPIDVGIDALGAATTLFFLLPQAERLLDRRL